MKDATPIAARWLFHERDERAGAVRARALPLLSVSQFHGVVPRADLADDDGRALDLSRYKICAPGDVVLNRMSAYQGAVGYSRLLGITSPDYMVLRPSERCCGRYLSYLMKSAWFVGEMTARLKGIGTADSTGVRTPRIGRRELGEIVVALPSPVAQSEIVEFLDYETGEIDAFIADQEHLIDLLTERRRAAIRQEMTGGDLVPLLAQRQPSALGSVSAVGYHFSVQLGKMLDAGRGPRDGETDARYLRASNVKQGRLDLGDVKSMPFSPAERSLFSIKQDDLLVVEGGATSGACVVVRADMPDFAFQKTLNRVRRLDTSAKNDTVFLAFVLELFRSAGVVDAQCNQSTMPHFTAEKLRALRIPWPSRSRRQEAVASLVAQTETVAAAIRDAREAIALSKERRAVLISAAVTGQIDVRDWKRPADRAS
jgi:type I restriction enzyme S subunit